MRSGEALRRYRMPWNLQQQWRANEFGMQKNGNPLLDVSALQDMLTGQGDHSHGAFLYGVNV